MQRIGVFVCTGCDIGEAIKVDELEDLCEEGGSKAFSTHPCLCSPEGVGLIRQRAREHELDGALLAACSPRAKQQEFSLGPIGVERVSLREHVAWSHPHGDEDTQLLAEDLMRMGLVRLSKLSAAEPVTETIDDGVLVVGGGVAGLEAARVALALGQPVALVEGDERLGGALAAVNDWIPTGPPYDQIHQSNLGELIDEVVSHARSQIFVSSKVSRISGQPGQFDVEIDTGGSAPGAGRKSLRLGAIVQATGAEPYDASRIDHLGYDASPDVITSHELEAMLAAASLRRPSDGRLPQQIVFVQCAGSRDEDHLPYCSVECCATTLKQAAVIQRDYPDQVDCAIVYRDIRTAGQLERFYLAVQEQPRVMLTRGDVQRVSASAGGLRVDVSESLLGEELSLDADLVVLAVGMVPRSADGEAIRDLRDAEGRIKKNESAKQVADAKKVVEQLKRHEGSEILNLEYRQGPDLPALRYAFPDSHYICFPYETRRTGIYAAGTVRAPMEPSQAAEDGCGAAMKAVQCIEMAKRGEAVHPRAGDIAAADFFLQRCTQCKRCTEECPFGAINEDVKGTPEYKSLRCRRCGICLGACPERIISFPEYSVDAIASMIKAVEVPEEDEEKPRIVALLCENDAYPALDKAALAGAKWNPWVRIIPVRCLGACNNVWIADALSRGIDGLVLIGCKSGDDYQCHYIRGSELASVRLTNVKETLDRLTLESERVKVVELAHDEFHRIPEVLDEFVSEIEDVGPNPYKGF